MVQDSKIESEISYYDYENQKRKINSYSSKKMKNNQHNFIIKKENNQKKNQSYYPGNAAELYSFNDKIKKYQRCNDEEISQDISRFDENTEREIIDMDSKSQILENYDFPKKGFINFNHKHMCWREFEFPYDFSSTIYLVNSKNHNENMKPKILLPQNSALKYLVKHNNNYK